MVSRNQNQDQNNCRYQNDGLVPALAPPPTPTAVPPPLRRSRRLQNQNDARERDQQERQAPEAQQHYNKPQEQLIIEALGRCTKLIGWMFSPRPALGIG